MLWDDRATDQDVRGREAVRVGEHGMPGNAGYEAGVYCWGVLSSCPKPFDDYHSVCGRVGMDDGRVGILSGHYHFQRSALCTYPASISTPLLMIKNCLQLCDPYTLRMLRIARHFAQIVLRDAEPKCDFI